MTHHHSTFTEPENMDKAEGILRGVVGMAFIEAVLLIPSLSETSLAAFSAASIYIVLTGITRWDPIYAVIGKIGSHPSSAPERITPVQRHDDKPEVGGAYKKAA